MAHVVRERERVAAELRQLPGFDGDAEQRELPLGATVKPAAQVVELLLARGVLVRSFHTAGGRMAAAPPCHDWLAGGERRVPRGDRARRVRVSAGAAAARARRVAAHAAIAIAACAGCAGSSTVRRAYGDCALDGRFVDPQAYALVLRGVMAEAAGDPTGALGTYVRASRLDPHGPEVWARIWRGPVLGRPTRRPDRRRVRTRPRRGPDVRARVARARDLRAPPGCTRCRRGRGSAGASAGRDEDATAVDRGARDRRGTRRRDERRGSRGRVERARALGRRARRRGRCWGQALAGLAKVAPLERASVARAAEQLAGPWASSTRPATWPLPWPTPTQSRRRCRRSAARLAIDEALDWHDLGAARRRSARWRVADDEVAARALLAGQVDAAREVASRVVRGGGSTFGAALVLAAIEHAPAPAVVERTAPASAAAWVAYARELPRGAAWREDARFDARRTLPHAAIRARRRPRGAVRGGARVTRRDSGRPTCRRMVGSS